MKKQLTLFVFVLFSTTPFLSFAFSPPSSCITAKKTADVLDKTIRVWENQSKVVARYYKVFLKKDKQAYNSEDIVVNQYKILWPANASKQAELIQSWNSACNGKSKTCSSSQKRWKNTGSGYSNLWNRLSKVKIDYAQFSKAGVLGNLKSNKPWTYDKKNNLAPKNGFKALSSNLKVPYSLLQQVLNSLKKNVLNQSLTKVAHAKKAWDKYKEKQDKLNQLGIFIGRMKKLFQNKVAICQKDIKKKKKQGKSASLSFSNQGQCSTETDEREVALVCWDSCFSMGFIGTSNQNLNNFSTNNVSFEGNFKIGQEKVGTHNDFERVGQEAMSLLN